MGDLFLTIYVCTCVRTWYVRTYRNMSLVVGHCKLSLIIFTEKKKKKKKKRKKKEKKRKNMSRSGMLIGMLWVSCRPVEFYLLRGLDVARTTTLRNRSVDERAVLQGLQSWSSYIRSQTVSAVDICYTQLHNSLA